MVVIAEFAVINEIDSGFKESRATQKAGPDCFLAQLFNCCDLAARLGCSRLVPARLAT